MPKTAILDCTDTPRAQRPWHRWRFVGFHCQTSRRMRYWSVAGILISVRVIEVSPMTAMPPNFNPLRFCTVQRVSADDRRLWIETAAYYRAEHRGFVPGLSL